MLLVTFLKINPAKIKFRCNRFPEQLFVTLTLRGTDFVSKVSRGGSTMPFLVISY
jgi:hypothetical protein